jgi:uncharacterized repeat protein (TIGR02543 family)
MRCKNCGSQNDDNLYICQNCGSPLYDEDRPAEANGGTKVFDVPLGDEEDDEIVRSPRLQENARKEEQQKKKYVALIAVLAVLLVAVIIGTVIAATHKKNEDVTTTESTSVSETTESTTESTTAQSTTESTTESTTASTTTTTTTTTTTEAAKTYSISLNSNGGGEVEGDGNYKLGENITVYARPDDDYNFDGWYSGNTRVSTKEAYSFTVTQDFSLKAIFTLKADESGDVDDGGQD